MLTHAPARLLAAVAASAALATAAAEDLPGARFDGERFHNEDPIEEIGLGDLIYWRATREPGPWPEWVEIERRPPPPERVGPGALRVTWVNHATVLLQIDGRNILTDPIWSERASPVGWAGPKRVHAPGIAFDDLPPIDAVVISHDHYDHLDLPTLILLNDLHHPTFFVGRGTRALLEGERIEHVVELDWWRSAPLGGSVTITSVPAVHRSGRGATDRFERLWMGYVIEASGGPVYFAGDTGWGRHFGEIARRFGPMRLAMLPIGAYLPRWFMRSMHVNPDEAVRAHEILLAEQSLAIHWGTFELSDEARDDPPAALRRALEDHVVPPGRFWVFEPGEGRTVPPLEGRPLVASSPPGSEVPGASRNQ